MLTKPTVLSALGAALVLAALLPAWGQQPPAALSDELSPRHHPWAKFEPGAWKKVRVITESLDEQGGVVNTSVSYTNSYLKDVAGDGYELEVQVSMEVAGRRFDADPQFLSLGMLEETAGQTTIKETGEMVRLAIDKRRVPCRVYQVEVKSQDERRVSKVYFASTTSPHLLRKESVTTDPSGKNTLYETTEEVIAVNMPQTVLGQTHSTSHVKTVREHSKGMTVTLAVHSDRVPGGVVAHTQKELDAQGRLVRRSTLEVVSYGLDGFRDDRPRGLFRRRR